MNILNLVRAGGVIVAAFGLAGCIDVSMDVTVIGEDQASVTVTTAMDRATYDQAKSSGGGADFCDEGSQMTLSDASATCVEVITGTFAEVFQPGAADGQPQPTITTVSPGVYRVTFPTGGMTEELAGSGGDDPQMLEMMKAMFAGHKISMSISGDEIIETNMVKSADGKSAFLDITFDELFAGGTNIPSEAFAVVRAE